MQKLTKRWIGPAEQILAKAYIDFCDSALEDFCAIFWPCTFSNKLGRCVNVQDRHKKGHQNEKGKIIGTGEYISDFTWETFADDWERLLQEHLSHFQTNVQQQITYDTTISELVATTNLHHANVNAFYQRLGGAQRFISHSACFCCLREMAEHPLSCGHVLCTPCIKGYGKAHEGTAGLYTVATCPLHEADTAGQAPWEVHFKPPLAGVRILSLDGFVMSLVFDATLTRVGAAFEVSSFWRCFSVSRRSLIIEYPSKTSLTWWLVLGWCFHSLIY